MHFLTNMEDGQPKVKVLAGFDFWQELSAWLADGHLLVCPQMAERERSLFPYKAPGLTSSEPHYYALL